ncbi:SCO family protein [Sorangium sp. So ce131]|uniref:SCO family protein n=1 Tax=Sorangium sp. So ce131 TaxID=3133282 RepID=UPI003F5ECDB6
MNSLPLHGMRALLLAGALAASACARGERAGDAPAAPALAGPAGAPAAPALAGPAGAPAVRVAPAPGVELPDEELVDQDGAPVRLRELAEGRVLVVNFVFTTCTTICSPMTAIFGRLQGELGDALGREVRLVSISLDPATDTPERLNRYAEKFGRRPGWVFLTGSRERVRRVLDALGGRAPVKEQHTPITLIGRAAEGRWTRVDGIAPPGRLAEEVRAFLPGGPQGARAPAARSASPGG